MPSPRPPGRPPAPLRALARPTLICALVGACFLAGSLLRAGDLRLAAVPVLHVETVVPACAPAASTREEVTMLTAYLARERADAVAGIVVTGAEGRRAWMRSGGTCDSEGVREPCPAEACREGTCAVRLPMPSLGPGPLDVRVLDADGVERGRGSVEPRPGRAPGPPELDVTRQGRDVAISGRAGAIARVSVIRQGRVAADVPTTIGAGGTARFRVPEGAEAVRVAVSSGEGDGVAQASAFLPGPFASGCPD